MGDFVATAFNDTDPTQWQHSHWWCISFRLVMLVWWCARV